MTLKYEVEINVGGRWRRTIIYVGTYDKEDLESAKAAYNEAIRRCVRR